MLDYHGVSARVALSVWVASNFKRTRVLARELSACSFDSDCACKETLGFDDAASNNRARTVAFVDMSSLVSQVTVVATLACSSSHDIASHADQIHTAGAAAPTLSATQTAENAAPGRRAATGQGSVSDRAASPSPSPAAAAPSGGMRIQTQDVERVERQIEGGMLDDIRYAFDVNVPAGAEEFRCIYAQRQLGRVACGYAYQLQLHLRE
jgi:hypothetical protein